MKPLLIVSLLVTTLFATPLNSFAQQQLGVGRKYTRVERLQMARLQAVRQDRLRYAKERRAVNLKTG